MIKLSLSFLATMFIFGGFTSYITNNSQNLKVTISGFHNNKGAVLVSLFKDVNGFPDDAAKAYGKEKAYLVNNTASIIFKTVPPGNYAIAILHDENNNQKLDKNILGIPKEGFGFSNNASAPFGPPSFNKASFIHTTNKPTDLQIKIKYF